MSPFLDFRIQQWPFKKTSNKNNKKFKHTTLFDYFFIQYIWTMMKLKF